jgi:hypothetical protein
MEQFSNKIFKQGDSFCIVIPKIIRIKLDLHVGDRPIILISTNGCSNCGNKNDDKSTNS